MKIRISKVFYKSVFDNMLDGLAYCKMLFDEQGNPVDFIFEKINKNFERLTGLKKVLKKKAADTIPGIKTSNPELFDICGRVSLTGKPEKFEIYIAPLSRWFSFSVYSLKKGFFMMVFHNITVRKTIEKNLENAKVAAQNVLEDLQFEKEKLAETNAKDEALLGSIGEGLVAVDNDRKVIIMNKIAATMLGWKAKDLMGKVLTDLPLQDEEGNLIPLEKRPTTIALQTGKTVKVSYYFVRKDKTRFPMAITATPIVLGGKVIGLIEIIRDITLEKEIDKAKSEFISLASHQLKTPPTAIKILTERLLGGKMGKLTKKQGEYLGDIQFSNERMIELINTFLNVSRIELGAFNLQASKKNICIVMHSIISELKSLAEKKQIKLKVIYPKNDVYIIIDEPLFRMVITNLITNAVDYTPAGGEIKVECKRIDEGQTIGGKILEESNFIVIVSDNGCGIPKVNQESIFTKFYRADNSRDKKADGTGLGLYIVKSIIEHSSGSIWFTSVENKGTTFYVSIPISGMKAKIKKK